MGYDECNVRQEPGLSGVSTSHERRTVELRAALHVDLTELWTSDAFRRAFDVSLSSDHQNLPSNRQVRKHNFALARTASNLERTDVIFESR